MKQTSTRKMNVDFKTTSTMKFAFIAILAISSLFSIQSFALNPADFTVTRVTAPFFPVDANRASTFTKSYVGFEVKNTSGSASGSLTFSIESLISNTAGQNFSVVFPTSKSFSVGSIAAGTSKVFYFYISYPANSNESINATINTKLSDNTLSSKATAFTMPIRSLITAPPGGTTRQSAFTATNGDIYDDITYTIGKPGANVEMDFQPSVSDLYDPLRLSLVSAEVISSQVGGVPVGSTDSLYFIGSRTGNINPNQIVIRYRFKPNGLNSKTFILPYCAATSGTQYKYTLKDTGGINGVALGNALLVLAKTSDKSVYNVCDTAVFKLKIKNNSAFNFSVDSIKDQLPSRFAFIGFTSNSSITSSMCSSKPMNMDTGAIKFIGGVSVNGNNSFYVAAGDSVTLEYTAKVSCIPLSSVTTEARGFTGGQEFDHSYNTVSVITDPIRIPNAINDYYTVYEGRSITKDVSFNDYQSIDGGNNWAVVSGPSHGTVNFSTNGVFTYTPAANFYGKDTIRYRLCDVDNDCSAAIAVITVFKTPSNTLSTAACETFTWHSETYTDSGTYSDTLVLADHDSITILNLTINQPSQSTSTVSEAISYTWNTNTYTVSGTYSWTGTNASNCDSIATLNLTIDDAPIAVKNVFAPDQDLVFNGNVGNNDYLSNDGGNVFSLTSGPSNGTLTFNANGTFAYTPSLGFTDIDTFYYSLCDIDNDCSTAMVVLIIQAGGTTPVTLTTFNARLLNSENAMLNWNAQSEINTSHYDVERSEDGIHFTKRGATNAIGSASVSQNYNYTDLLNTSATVVYYRLKMVDNDGTFKYSNIVSLKLKDANNEMSVYPTPFVSNITITFTSQTEEIAKVKVMAIDGRILTQFDVKLQKGKNVIPVNNLGRLPKSSYLIELKTSAKSFVKRIVKI